MGIFDNFGYEPPQQDNNNVTKGLSVTENLVVGGVQYQNPLIPGAVSGTDRKGVPLPMYPDFETSSSSLEQDRAARSQGNTDTYRIAESFDMRSANSGVNLVSGQARATAIYVPYRQKVASIEVQMADYNVGGTYSYIGWRLYGPLTVDPSTGTTPIDALPQVTGNTTFAPSASTRDELIGSAGDLGGGRFLQDADTTVDLEPGVYYLVQLLVYSVAPGTSPSWIYHTPTSIGSIYSRTNASYVGHAYTLNSQTALDTTLDLTAYTATAVKQWVGLSTDASYI